MDENSIFNEQNLNNLEFLFNYAERFRFGELHVKLDQDTGLCAIIAIHNTKLGPALGGCRFIEYPSRGAAVVDAIRLARGMSYKAAVAGLPLGGGKAVIIKPPHLQDRESLFLKFGEFVDELGGKYITAKDSGSSMTDMDIIAQKTKYVTTKSPTTDNDVCGDPSYFTARGVLRSIEASAAFRLKKDSLNGLHVALQGAGAVASYLAKELTNAGAKITVCDIDADRVNEFAKTYNAKIVSTNDIYDVDCDIFSPSALGATINKTTIPRLNAKVIAGCANNQLECRDCGVELHKRGISYAPDYLANSGGLIFAAADYLQQNQDEVESKVDEIYDTLTNIYVRCEQENEAPNVITGKYIEEMIF